MKPSKTKLILAAAAAAVAIPSLASAEPTVYGNAGGTVGAERIAQLSSMHTTPVQTPVVGTAWDDEDHAGNKVAQLYGGYVLPRSPGSTSSADSAWWSPNGTLQPDGLIAQCNSGLPSKTAPAVAGRRTRSICRSSRGASRKSEREAVTGASRMVSA